nr:hyphal wall protein 1-like [Microcebus murinus]
MGRLVSFCLFVCFIIGNVYAGLASRTTLSTKDYAPKETVSYLSTTSALPNKKTDVSAAPLPTSPQTSSSTGSTEQTTPPHGTQGDKLSTTITTNSKSTTLSNSMMSSTLKDQGGTSRTTALPTMATSPETPKQNQSTLITTPSTSNPTVRGTESSVSTDSVYTEMSATITAPIALNTAGNDANSPRPMTTTVSENSAVSTSPRTSSKVANVKESSPMTTGAFFHSTLLTTTALATTVLGTTVSGTQEGKTTAALPAPTASTMTKPHPNTATQTPSYPAESASSVDTTTAQAPETMAAHSTALIPSSSGTTKSSITRTSQASPKHTQSSSPGTEACTVDEYPDSGGVCRCNKSYYAHSELFRVSRSLHCLPRKIEVLLSRCFLKTHSWVLAKGAFSACSNGSRIDQGLRVHVFMLEKKEGVCGLRLSVSKLTNSSHARYSLEVTLLHDPPDFTITNATVLSFSCTYPLVVNVSQTLPYPVVSFPQKSQHSQVRHKVGDGPSPWGFVVRVSLLSLFRYVTIHVPGTGDTVVILGIFTDPQLSAPLENRTAPIGKPLYVVLRDTSSDPDRFALVANEVFASTNISRMGAVEATYHFVNESCPVSNRLLHGLQANGGSLEVTLAFNLFRFFTSDTMYLHGRVTLCDKKAGRPCQPVSGQPRGP